MQHLYFLGIAGQTMSGLAIASKKAGYLVSGVDGVAYPPTTTALDEAGIDYFTRYAAGHITEEMTIVLGNAIPKDNVELQQAVAMNVPILSFPQLIEQLTQHQHRIVVAGTHGKTTTTTLIAWLLESAGQSPDVIIGMASPLFGGSARLQGAAKVVIEGDEYSSSDLDKASKFLYYHPDVLVLTSLEFDHPDMFADMAAMEAAYRHLLEDLSSEATIVACGDDARLMSLLKKSGKKAITYGVNEQSDWQARNIHFGPNETSFDVYHGEVRQERWTMQLAGEHNVLNALAALIVAEIEQVTTLDMANGLLGFAGASRRFEVAGEVNNITVIDDYAHHPTAVAVTLQAARQRYPKGKLWAYFKPHTYSRTSALLEEFAKALMAADYVLLSEVDAARESGQEVTVTANDLAERIGAAGTSMHHVVSNAAGQKLLLDNLQPGDTVVCMSVSGLKDTMHQLVEDLRLKWEA
jgi:UDP-N-acetylmuramate: L-alanyl-gamma-D-glutamyl-meso-diaminopimelate ligase